MLTRRRFLARTGAGLLAMPSFLEAAPDTHTFYVGVIADTHIIDEFYRGPEGNPEDTESIFKTEERLLAARGVLNALMPPLDRVFLIGDYFHDYPSPALEFYFRNSTRIDRAKALTGGFHAPVHIGFGNHDYAVPDVSRELTHTNFDPATNTLLQARDGSVYDRALVHPDRNNFGPCVAVAYSLNDRTVLRSAFGSSSVHFNRLGGENLSFNGPHVVPVTVAQQPPQGLCADGQAPTTCFRPTQMGYPAGLNVPENYIAGHVAAADSVGGKGGFLARLRLRPSRLRLARPHCL